MKEALLFLGQAARQWRITGTCTQSGPALVRAIADGVGPVADGQVILELGPGTGVVTRELVRRYPRARIVAVEVLEPLAAMLEQTTPGVTVIHGCASRLGEHLAGLGIAPDQVGALVSGVPLLSLPPELSRAVLASVTGTLPVGRRYVQFTYWARAWRKFPLAGLQPVARRRVWLNLPPASVLTFVREG